LHSATTPIELARWALDRGIRIGLCWKAIASFPEGDIFAKLVEDFHPDNPWVEVSIPEALENTNIIGLLHQRGIPVDTSIPPKYNYAQGLNTGDITATFRLAL
jgi:hypothetical protein